MNKNKFNKKILLCLILLLLVCCGLFFVLNNKEKPTETDFAGNNTLSEQGNQEKPEENKELDTLKVDLIDYVPYQLEGLDFKFILAKVRVKSNDPLNLTLDGFKTNEDVVLSNVDEYVKTLEDNALFLGKQNVWFEIISAEKSTVSNLFIPINDLEATSATLSFDFNDDVLEFDLTDPNSDDSLLKYVADDVIFDGKSYQMVVSNAYELTGEAITRTYPDGYQEAYLSPSTAQIHAFNVNVVSLWGDEIVIEEAYYTVNSTGEEFEAFSEQFSSEKSSNLLNKTVTETDSGVVFFETLNPTESPITYQGVLKLKVKGNDNLIVINVDL